MSRFTPPTKAQKEARRKAAKKRGGSGATLNPATGKPWRKLIVKITKVK